MRLAEAFRVALGALRANRLRSALTMLGVVIGVAAVVILVAIGTGAKHEVEPQVEGLGSNLMIVVPGKFKFGAAPTVAGCASTTSTASARRSATADGVAVDLQSGENVRAGTANAFATVNGTNENVPKVFNRPVARGDYLSPAPTWRPAAGSRCSARRPPASCSATSTRSAGRSPSAACGSG